MNLVKIISTLSELEEFLNTHKVNYVSVIHAFREKLMSVKSDDKEEINREISALNKHVFGGMSSLNDVWISKNNGHLVDNEVFANQKLVNFKKTWFFRNFLSKNCTHRKKNQGRNKGK